MERVTTRKKRIIWKRILGRILAHLILIGLGVIFFFPFYWLASTSMKPDPEIFVLPPKLIPSRWLWSNYVKAVNFFPFFLYLKNTLIVSGASMVGAVFCSAAVGYSFARIRWPGRNIVFGIMLSTLMLPFQVRMIPLFLLFKRIGWIGTFLPLTVPAYFGNPFFIFLLRQFFLSFPFELSDAAKIDGCSEYGIFWRILLPLSKPALATVALFQFIFSWQDFIGPLIYLSDTKTYTLSLGLQQFLTEHGAEWALLMAASTLTTLPIIILFFFAQRTFIQGITLTGLKG